MRRSAASRPTAPPRPSASVILLSPLNHVLLLHRVQTGSYASAHVFPGGNLDERQDGNLPPVDDPTRHKDSPTYRLAAIRECFEETGLLLAKPRNPTARQSTDEELLAVSEEERTAGRQVVHDGRITFPDWLQQHGGMPDLDGLIPFTRWLTPTNQPRRFSTQMYLYLMPLPSHQSTESSLQNDTSSKAKQERTQGPDESQTMIIPNPTADGGIEHTAAQFLPAQQWLDQAHPNKIILFPPQFFLLSLIAPLLHTANNWSSENQLRLSSISPPSITALHQDRKSLLDFIHNSLPPWTDRCICPRFLPRPEPRPMQEQKIKDLDERKTITKSTTTPHSRPKNKQNTVLDLSWPGHELAGTSCAGEKERIMLIQSEKGQPPRRLEVRLRSEFFDDERARAKL